MPKRKSTGAKLRRSNHFLMEYIKFISLAAGGPLTDDDAIVNFSPNFAGDILNDNSNEPIVEEPEEVPNGIPGAQPTPPPEPSPELPKIRIKTGLLKESLTITELKDNDNLSNNHENTIWATPSLEDPLKLPDSTEKDDNSIITNLFNNTDRAKDLGFTSSDEFMSIDRLDDRNRGALQVYNSNANSMAYGGGNPLDSLAGLPMQQLAEQVSRLKPGNGGGMHQQNVLINIQQFPQAPQAPHPFQPAPIIYSAMPQQPMYPQYQYQPPNIYYPPAPGYPPHMGPPRPQMPNQQPMPQQLPNIQPAPQFRPAMPRQPSAPRQATPRAPMAPRGVQMNPRGGMGPRQIAPRQPSMQPRVRQPMMRQRTPGPMQMRSPRPRGPAPQMQQVRQPQNGVQGPRMVKRTPEQIQALQAKRKRMDVLVPDKHDDADCEVIAVQPKNTGLPQIQSIQGGATMDTSSSTDSSIMHLSDSITLSVRKPPPKPASPKKSDATDVADILATRGITVTTATKKDKPSDQLSQKTSNDQPVQINLNSSVSLITSGNKNGKSPSESNVQTVDLTDVPDIPVDPLALNPPPKPVQPGKATVKLPFKCDLCPAQYPNYIGLSKHRQSFHKTGPPAEYGVPLINLRQPGLLGRLRSIGILNYIPVNGATNDGNYALPIVNVNNMKNVNLSALGVSSVLTLGPVKGVPKPDQPNNTANHK